MKKTTNIKRAISELEILDIGIDSPVYVNGIVSVNTPRIVFKRSMTTSLRDIYKAPLDDVDNIYSDYNIEHRALASDVDDLLLKDIHTHIANYPKTRNYAIFFHPWWSTTSDDFTHVIAVREVWFIDPACLRS